MPFITQGKINWKRLLIISVSLMILTVGGLLAWWETSDWPPSNAVKIPGTSQWVLYNELTILASGQDIKHLVSDFNGEIVAHISETDTYQVRFPVSSLEELDVIANQLKKKETGIQVEHSYLIEPSKPGGPQ